MVVLCHISRCACAVVFQFQLLFPALSAVLDQIISHRVSTWCSMLVEGRNLCVFLCPVNQDGYIRATASGKFKIGV